MPFNWFNYLHEEIDPATSMQHQIIYVIILSIAQICILIIFIYSIIKLKQNLPSLRELRSYILTMIGLVIWPMGEIIGTYVYIFTEKYSLFESTENIPFTFGIALAIVFFSRYIQYTLRTRKLIEKRELITHHLLNLATFIIAIPLLYIVIRFIFLGFMSVYYINLTDDVAMYLIIVLAIFMNIILFSAAIQLNREYKKLTSQLNRSRLLLFRIYIIIILIEIITLIVYLILNYVGIWTFHPLLMLYIAMLIYFFAFPAAIALHLGMFMPVWLQKRMGILPTFQKTEEVI